MSQKVSDILPKTEILAQLAEEASELAQAALKLRRALDGTNPTPKSVEECRKAFEEEYADSGCAESETELNTKGIYQKIASELAWCLGFNENDSKCYEKNEE